MTEFARWFSAHEPAVDTLLRSAYGIAGTVTLLAGEFDLNCRVDVDGAPAFVLKIMRRGCDASLVDLQCRLLEALAARVPAVPVPRVVPTRDGAATTTLTEPDGGQRLVWLLTFLPGRVMADARPHSGPLLREIGDALGRIDQALHDFEHPACERDIKWDPRRAGWVRPHLHLIADDARRRCVTRILDRFEAHVAPRLARTRTGVIYADANDHNVLVRFDADGTPGLAGLIDFGDAHRTALVGEVATASAYAMLGKSAPLDAAEAIAAGYDRVLPLTDDELSLVFPLILTRLAVSVVNSAIAARERPGDPYVTISEAPAWALLNAIARRDPSLAEARLRAACGRDPWPASTRVTAWLGANRGALRPLLDGHAALDEAAVLDLSFESTLGGDDPRRFDVDVCSRRVDEAMARAAAAVGIGRYGEPRPIYTQPAFGVGPKPLAPRRTQHLGIDLFVAAGTPLHTPLGGEVTVARYLPDPLDYGGMVILRHHTTDGDPFETLYGHLARADAERLRPGQRLEPGDVFARVGERHENGGWPPHVHVQLLVDRDASDDAVPNGVADPEDFAARAALSPCPAPLLGLDVEAVSWRARSLEEQRARRDRRLAANVKLSYADPVRPVRAHRHFLYDEYGRTYLDAYNNVPHVGHCHPHVVEAAARQMRLLSTNTRYLHDGPLAYAERLVARLPPSLSVCFFVNSGSEGNELALRLARAHTRARDMLVMEHAYHGHTTGTIDISPYKFTHPRAGGAPPWVHVTPQPDVYRGRYRRGDPDAGDKYAALVSQSIDQLQDRGIRIAGYIAECVPSVGGQIVLPPGFLAGVYHAVRHAGGVCIADDVQTALGRIGSHCWGFEPQDVVPDILVLGKPLGNGYPLGAVVTTAEIAGSFADGPEFFSTFGGSTVSCAAGLAVLDVLDEEQLQRRASTIGDYLLTGLRELAVAHALIGDVRGTGLFIGVELVTDRAAQTPATRQARHVVNRLRERRVLVGTEGPHDCVLKIRPPMSFDEAAADALLGALADVLGEAPAQPDFFDRSPTGHS